MRYLSVSEIAKKWNISERSIRNYCTRGREVGAFLAGKTWNIPEKLIKELYLTLKNGTSAFRKECFYCRGLKECNDEKGYLTDPCLTAQDKYKAYLNYFRIVY